MIDVSSLTQLAQVQPVPVDTPRPVAPVSAVQSSPKGEASGQEQNRRSGPKSLDANLIMGRDTSLKFRIDQDYDRLVVTLMDIDGKTVRQIPSDLIMQIAQRLEEIQADGKMGLDERA